MLCAMWLAYTERNSKDKLDKVKQYYEALSSLKLSLATPFLANLRTNNPSLSSCFITAVDDTLESIMQVVTDAAVISKKGGGVGINVSALRAKGSTVNGVANASGGVVPWIKIFNDIALAVSQVKSNRVGAITIALDVWHKDIYDFLDLQTENGDQRRKAFDIFPQIVLPNAFIQAALTNQSWFLFDPYLLQEKSIDLVNCANEEFESRYEYAVKNVSSIRVKAKDLFKQIIKVQVETGLPYLFFKDNVNAVNPHKQQGTILNGNLCMESYSIFNSQVTHCCNLISLNLARLLDKSTWDYYINLAVQMLNNAFDCTEEPTRNSKRHNQALKTIGLGVMGLADYLAYNKLLYDKDTITPLFARIFDSVVYASACIAKKTKSYKYYNSDFWLHYLEDKVSVLTYDQVKRYGLANGQLMAIAPNTSSSIIGGCTASILPAYDLVFNNKDSKGDNIVASPFSSTHQWFYATQKNTTQDTITDVISGIQNYVDQGISMELFFDLNTDGFEAKDIYNTIINAWQKGCKAIYYVRTVQKTLNDCISCAN
jgi:ribonucleoside-diphosphate reductase alpha chain